MAMLVTDSLTNCRLVNLINVTLACEDANSNLIEVVTVAHIDAHDHVGNSLFQIWKLRFGQKSLTFVPTLSILVKILNLKFRRDFEAEVWSVFCC